MTVISITDGASHQPRCLGCKTRQLRLAELVRQTADATRT